MFLQRMSKSVQQIADAIATALGANVTIVDNNLLRVAGTGPYFQKIGEEAPQRSVFAQVLKQMRVIIIAEPGENPLCLDCALKQNCVETYEICAPIICQESVVGVISIFASDDQQKKVMIEKNKQYINFIEQMSNLIASKIGEYRLLEEITTYNKELDIIIQNLNQGVLSVNVEGRIKHINKKALSLLSLPNSPQDLIGAELEEFWPGSLVLKALAEEKEFYEEEELYDKKHLLSTVRLIRKDKRVISGVATFSDLDDMQKSVYQITSSGNGSFADIIGISKKIINSKRKALQVAAHDSTVLITGESGTGKEVFARAIHNGSSRANHPFIAINCSAIPESLLESELFGYATGAFTGASRRGKPGKFELAHQGTIFLDEIGDMPLFLQSKLLRVLQDKTLIRVGGISTVDIDVRVIAATNNDLEELIANKMFRKDLYYRLNVIPLRLAPLREKREDIPVLIEHFIYLYSERFQKEVAGFTPEAMRFLLAYDWPGNVRELENVIEYGINFCRGSYIKMEDIQGRFKASYQINSKKGSTLKEMVQSYEREVVKNLLDKYGWDERGKEKAAVELDISRATLYRKLSQN